MALTNLDTLVANVGSTEVTSTAGAGATGTGTPTAPRTWRRTQDGVIITQIKFDITGLKAKGDAADDVIGLDAATDAYIGRYVVADYGVVYKATLSCIEVAAAASGTITVDIDIAADSASDKGHDEAVGGTTLINGGTLVAGQTKENLVATTTANDYIYIVEGDTAANEGTYASGQYILTFYGHAALA